MIKRNKNFLSGFSLVESLISLMILMLVVIISMASITRKRTVPISKTTISGVYACWNGQSEQYDGHTYNPNKSKDCKFEMDRRAYKYQIYAVGSRTNEVDPQVKQVVIPAPVGNEPDKMSLIIEPGDSINGGITTVKYDNDNPDNKPILEAKGGFEVDNESKLIPGNIKRCKWISGGNCSYSSTCKVDDIKNTESSTIGKKNPYKTSIVINCNKIGGDGKITSSFVCQADTKKWKKQGDSNIYTTDNCEYSSVDANGEPETGTVTVTIENDDSKLSAVASDIEDSQFIKYIKMIPQSIQNGLTDKLYNEYKSSYSKGAVFIIW